MRQLEVAMANSDLAEARLEVFHGPTSPEKREEIKHAFNADPAKHPIRILVATDAAREGLNLQTHCWNLFHFDIPWNPSRMEQRNGRIDRKLQPNPEVFCHYFVYTQRPEDRILQVLVRKTETIKQELGSLSQVIDSRLTASLSKGIIHQSINLLEQEIESAHIDDGRMSAIKEELDVSRERQNKLREQIERLETFLEHSRKSIGLDDSHFRAAISCSLELMGSKELKTIDNAEEGFKRFQFPALDERLGADPTWAATMDTLRMPRKKDQKLWEWRNSSPVRAVVFEDPGTLDDEVVHLHLEQRVVQRLLGRFTAQGFLHHDLSRACFGQTKDSIPRVVLLGRLCLYGMGGARLHEELISVTAQWDDPKIRKSSLCPFPKEDEVKTLSLLDASLRESQNVKLTSDITGHLKQSATGDIEQLLPYLEKRGQELAIDAGQKLTERGEAEATSICEILERQQQYILSTSKRFEKINPEQLLLDFGNEEERLQLDANKRYWTKRLSEISEELKTEPARIKEQYSVKAQRIEPVGLVYLWPETGAVNV